MRQADTLLHDALRNDAEVFCTPKLIAEWNHNRYTKVTADNENPTEADNSFDPDYFPAESVTDANRPNKAAAKLVVEEGNIFDPNSNAEIRYTLSSIDDIYRYWLSQDRTDSTGTFPLADDGVSTTRPFIVYDAPVLSNYIVIKLQNSFASPAQYFVKIRKDGVWYSSVTNPTIQADGSIRLYYDGVWSDIESMGDPIAIDGVMLQVDSMGPGRDLEDNITTYTRTRGPDNTANVFQTDGHNCHLHLIEISARLRQDISEHLINTNTVTDMGSQSILYPIGTITTNQSTITLSNTDRTFNDNNPDSPYFGLIKQNVKLLPSYVYEIGGQQEEITDGIWYVNSWGGDDEAQKSVDCSDYSKFLQAITPPKMLFSNLTFPQIVCRVLDSVGFVNHNIDLSDTDDIVPVFWTDGSKSVWEVLSDLSEGTQTAVYFDSLGVLNVKTRGAAYDTDIAPVWTVWSRDQEQPAIDGLPDLISAEVSNDDAPNNVNVSYTTTEWNSGQYGLPATEQVWAPDGDVVLRSCPLVKDLGTDDPIMYVSEDNAAAFPFEGKVYIDTEMIGVYGKEYVFYDGTTRTTQLIFSSDEQKRHDRKAAYGYMERNKYTGGLAIAVKDSTTYTDARGMENTEVAEHKVDTANYSVRSNIRGQTINGAGGFFRTKKKKRIKRKRGKHESKRHYKKHKYRTVTVKHKVTPDHNVQHIDTKSALKVRTGNYYHNNNDILVATIGNIADSMQRHWGTKITFNKDSGARTQEAGIVIASNTGEDGYYINIRETNHIGTSLRKSRNEIVVYSRINNKRHNISPKHGAKVAVAEDVPIELDVDLEIDVAHEDHYLTVSINGNSMYRFKVPDQYKQNRTGRFGLFVSGQTNAEFDYLYAINDTSEDQYIPDDYTFFDVIDGGFRGQRFDREWLCHWREGRRHTRKGVRRVKYRRNIYFYDEFGPMVHEIRDYDVNYDPNPVMYGDVYLSNDSEVACTYFSGTPFGSKFRLVNIARENAIINGSDDDVNQVLAVFGRSLIVSDAVTVNAKNDQSIRERGEQDAELGSTWIQTKGMAQNIADWIKNHWAGENESLSVTIFGNPLFEIADVIHLYYDELDIDSDYFVVGVTNSFGEGLSTTLTLKRRS